MGFIEQIENCMPGAPSDAIPWERLDPLLAAVGFAELKATPQNPAFHGEGDVYTHTQMVCRELAGDPAFYALPGGQRVALFLAALLHDVGKARTTKLEGGSWVSPHHGATGSRMVREFLWRDCGLCGTREGIALREAVCALVRCHMLPLHLLDREAPERMAREVAATGELAPDFSWKLLCMLARADVRGRIAQDIDEGLARVELAEMMAEEAGCLHAPRPFADGYTKRAYFSGRNVLPDQALYDDSWGEVILLSGLPGTGKDTWIRRRHPDLPVVSLDEIRAGLGIRPTDGQGEVVQAARERARELLRRKQPFIWNATDLTRDTRQRLTGLFERYGARVRIVYLEADWNVRVARNCGRANAVPEDAVCGMLRKTVPPTPVEAQIVEWVCV